MTPKEKLIAGAVAAFVFLSILFLLLWFSGPAVARENWERQTDTARANGRAL